MPAIGIAGSTHLRIGSGALLSYKLIPPVRATSSTYGYWDQMPLGQLKSGADPAAGLASLQAIGHKFTQLEDDGSAILPVERPAYRPGPLEGAEVHQTIAGRGHRLAGECAGRHRLRRRHPAGHRTRPISLELFVHQISAVPDATVPGMSIVLIAVAGLVLANLVAAIPDRLPARISAAQLLRGE